MIIYSRYVEKMLLLVVLLLHESKGHCQFKNIKASYLTNGLQSRVHGNHKRLPHNTLPFETKVHAVQFIKNYAEANAILLPGRIPGYKRTDIQLLPSNTTKKAC